MTYDFLDEDKRLGFVKTHWANYNGVEVDQIHKLYYGDYLTSENETIKALLKVRQTTNVGELVLENVKVYRNCQQCPVYDDLDEELKQMSLSNAGILGSGGGS